MKLILTEKQFRWLLNALHNFECARNGVHRDGYDIAKHEKNTSDNIVPDGCNGKWENYWEKQHPSHHFPSEPHICPSCLCRKKKFVGAHVLVNSESFIYPLCKKCNDTYKGKDADSHFFYITSEDKVRAPED